ncbi:TolC family protein [Aquimarina sp. AD1]|uniref:TolC family protein n=1 Tax=Aquimarina sp. (strain AD1) TaxID=1714848 RepID=UPI000E5080CF|nr:TolC family protein [Aquimarina sp. AD1]AXT58099.1 TolC family protein [Aquimarina sp. AD1]RKN37253.1 TolC family protein [Aquimarina sp. AD1]
MKNFKTLTILFVFLSISPVISQNVLTLDEAIKITVEKNYDVRIAKNNTEVSNIEKGVLNSGYLPTVSVSGGINYSDEAQNVTFSDGSNTNIDNAITESYNASVTAEYTIFDGLERKFNTQKNSENFNLKKIEERQLIENTIVSLYDTYYNVAYQKQITENLLLNIENSKDRLERTKKKLKYGQGSKLDELNAQVDLNNDSISYASAYKDFKNLKRNLNLLLGRDITIEYVVDTTVVFLNKLSEDAILQKAINNNVTSLLNRQNILLSELDIKINKAKFLPKINGSASYNWNESMNPVTSFALNNETYGVNLGLSLSWNLFDGGKNKTKVRTSKITKQNREIELYKAREELKTEVYNAYEDYFNKQFTLKAENHNIATNQLNFSRTQKQFSLGQVSAVEFRQAQINLFNALNNCVKAKYDLKIAETNLLQLGGILLE